jgi:hypothetical protein
MALRRKIVGLGRLHLLYNPDEIGRIGQIAVMQYEIDISLVWILI